MGGFLACFRIKNCERPKTQLVSKSVASKNRDLLVTKNPLTSVFLCEEKDSSSDQPRHLSLRQNFDRESADEELRDEVKFLKSCGVLLETPVELRKGSEKAVRTHSGDGLHSNFDPRFLDSSCKTLHWEDQGDQFSDTATAVHEHSDPLESIHGSRYFEEDRTQRKIVRFDEGVEHISRNDLMESANLNISPQTENQIQQCGSDDSPYLTPRSLSDDLMTPGTACTPRSTGNDTRIQTHYVYPVQNTVQNLSQWKEMREGSVLDQSDDKSGQQRDSWIQHGDRPKQTSLSFRSRDFSPDEKSGQDQHELDSSQETPKLVVSSLSQWLKPPLSKEERWKAKNATRERSPSDKSPDADRPIIGTVAAHWNDNEPARVSPKWYDGNGIPNSTNKYKEDQKVSWHATPFEERLEKALSDEKLLPRREVTGRHVNLEEEDEECDTSASKTQLY